jgi:hypothetical protein
MTYSPGVREPTCILRQEKNSVCCGSAVCAVTYNTAIHRCASSGLKRVSSLTCKDLNCFILRRYLECTICKRNRVNKIFLLLLLKLLGARSSVVD